MSIEIKAPTFPESVADGTIANWLKKEGENVNQDEVIAEIETDKVVLEVLAQSDGIISKIVKNEGETVISSEIIGEFEETNGTISEVVEETIKEKKEEKMPVKAKKTNHGKKIGPAAKKIIAENDINPDDINPTGKDKRITKADLVNHLSSDQEIDPQMPSLSSREGRPEKRVPMSRLRSTIAKRLVSVKQETAMLTTFNEVDMLPIKDLRSKYGEEFENQHDVKLGFMGFFVIAAVQALKKFPSVNASIDENDIVYHGFQDIGVAVSTERGLVVPVIKDADSKSLSEIEQSILNYSDKAKKGKLSIEDMQGGTFTISNGGVFGSLLSTPILNAPQTAILGMHSIQERPVVINQEITIRPMMYLALSYDHRLLDGKEAVTFLVSIKEQLESPERLLLNL
ncbi:MAG: 2-oxoglutarate dehydrogenase complex dihydrolipoyllysine-residue succinyltransferase [SAR86 cluster bacterium]|uniref:Dihydrolipoyllysine-residue succinyltransferase component of 2-oxoglutarate dehydrogenase complex n=1 Tax=SAR86 cluster bacterium TaxID=2030880 RepID=A0A520N245_9GAMM|nr:MAG: 2-oxoglutarate dehydrogenase complex dihydrolipoyllysine-residue succinyltransferase [SAR86 cluster bacterium]|tara:strand:- start:4788 stop:5984 length:1197 start_codon:yes stop_codon:yes gene_type:complete